MMSDQIQHTRRRSSTTSVIPDRPRSAYFAKLGIFPTGPNRTPIKPRSRRHTDTISLCSIQDSEERNGKYRILRRRASDTTGLNPRDLKANFSGTDNESICDESDSQSIAEEIGQSLGHLATNTDDQTDSSFDECDDVWTNLINDIDALSRGNPEDSLDVGEQPDGMEDTSEAPVKHNRKQPCKRSHSMDADMALMYPYNQTYIGSDLRIRSRTLEKQDVANNIQNDISRTVGFRKQRAFSLNDSGFEDVDYGCELNQRRRRAKSFYANCDIHSKGKLALFCNTCVTPICLMCRANDHSDHNFTTIESAAINRRGSMRRIIDEYEDMVDHYNTKIEDFKHYQNELAQKHRLVKDDVKTRCEELHRYVDKWYNKTVHTLDMACKSEISHLSQQISEIQHALEELNDTKEHIEQLLKYQQSYDFMSLSKDLGKRIHEINSKHFTETAGHLCSIFTKGTELTPDMFGSLTVVRTNDFGPELHHISHARWLHSFDSRKSKTSQFNASGLSVTATGDLIVADIGIDLVQKFDPQGNLLLTYNTLPADHPTHAVEINPNCVMIACTTGLKVFNQAGEFGHKLKKKVELPQALARSNNGDLICSDLVEDGCLIHIIAGADLRVIHTIIGGNRAPCFHKPWYVTVDLNNNIVVTDFFEHNVKIFSAFGMLIHEFGGKGHRPGSFFHPAGLCVDSYGHILVADCYNNRVQMFSSEGDLIGILLNGTDNGLWYPTDLVINPEGHLVVLQGNGEVTTYQYIY